MTIVKIGEVVEEDNKLKRFMFPVQHHAKENGLIWPEMRSIKWGNLKEALGGGPAGGQFATALLRLAKVDEEERLQQGGFQCSCGEIFAFQRHQIGHEKKHKREIEIGQREIKIGQYGAKGDNPDDPIELSGAKEEEEEEVDGRERLSGKRKLNQTARVSGVPLAKIAKLLKEDKEGDEEIINKMIDDAEDEMEAYDEDELKKAKLEEKNSKMEEEKKKRKMKEEEENEKLEEEAMKAKEDALRKAKEEKAIRLKPNKEAEAAKRAEEEEKLAKKAKEEAEKIKREKADNAIKVLKEKALTAKKLKEEEESLKKTKEDGETVSVPKEDDEVVVIEVEEGKDNFEEEEKSPASAVEEPCPKCSLCDFAFSSKEVLRIHIGEVHLSKELEAQLAKIFPARCEGKCGQCNQVVETEYVRKEHILVSHPWTALIKHPWTALVKLALDTKRADEALLEDHNEAEVLLEDEEAKEEEVLEWLLKKNYNQGGFLCPFCETSFESENVIGEHIMSQHEKGFEGIGETHDEDDEIAMNVDLYNEDDETAIQEEELVKEKGVKKVRKGISITAIVDQLLAVSEKNAKEVSVERKEVKVVKKQLAQECDHCDTVSRTGKELERHRRAVHDGKTYRCKQCGNGFKRSQGLKEHIQCVHNKVKFSCAKCGKVFGTRSNLQRHHRMQNACLPGAKSKYLPEGWTFRNKKKGLDILTSDGTKLESYIAVKRYMLFKESFTKKQMNMVYMFPDGKNHKTGQN